MPAKEVVRLGKEVGYEIPLSAVHNVRWQAKTNASVNGGSLAKANGKKKPRSYKKFLADRERVKESTATILRNVNVNHLRKPSAYGAGDTTEFLAFCEQNFRTLVKQAVREELRNLIGAPEA
jgi:hypothetical protein